MVGLLGQEGRSIAIGLALAAGALAVPMSGCHPVAVRGGATASADVVVPIQSADPLNLILIGSQTTDAPIQLGGTGVRVARGTTQTIGVAGSGITPATAFAVVGIGPSLSVIRFGMTQGGGQDPLPAVVLALAVPEGTPPGLYSIVAVRGTDVAFLTGSVEVF